MTTEERLEKLESELARAKRGNRRMVLAGVGLLLGMFALLVAGRSVTSIALGQEKAADKTVIRANEFILLDEQGRKRATLRMDPNGPTLRMSRENGKDYFVLSGSQDGGALLMVDQNGQVRLTLGVNEEGPGLGMFDKKGKSRVVLKVGQTETLDAALLTLVGENGKSKAILSVFKGGPRLDLYDEKGETRVSLGAHKDGPVLSLGDENGKTRVLVVSGKEISGFALKDEKGKTRAHLSAFSELGPSLGLADEKGVGRCTIGTTQTTTPDGKVITYPESSLLLFGPDGKLIWEAP